jgi:hypothetical protein
MTSALYREDWEICSDFSRYARALCTLWDMIDTPTWNLVNHASNLTAIRDNMKARYHALIGGGYASVKFSENDRESIQVMDAVMRPWLHSHHMFSSIDRLDRVMEYAAEAGSHVDDVANLLTTLLQAMEDELKRRKFLYVPHEDAEMYEHPEKCFSKTLTAFPSAKHDIEEACKCFALGLYTACVFHSMAVLQVGLYAMAKDLGVSFKHSIQLAEWQGVIAGIEAKIEPLRHMPKSDQRDELLSFFSGCAAQFRYFKDAWRNHVAHMREVYSRVQAQSVLLHVQDFMEQVSTRLQE